MRMSEAQDENRARALTAGNIGNTLVQQHALLLPGRSRASKLARKRKCAEHQRSCSLRAPQHNLIR